MVRQFVAGAGSWSVNKARGGRDRRRGGADGTGGPNEGLGHGSRWDGTKGAEQRGSTAAGCGLVHCGPNDLDEAPMEG